MHRAGCTRSTLYALYTGHAVHRGHNTRRTRCPLYTLRTAHTGSAARCTQCTLCTLHPVNAVPCTRSTPVRLGPLKDDLWIWKPRKPPFWLPSKRRPLGGREKTWKTTFQKKDDLPKKKDDLWKKPLSPRTGLWKGRGAILGVTSSAGLPTTSSFGNRNTYIQQEHIHTYISFSLPSFRRGKEKAWSRPTTVVPRKTLKQALAENTPLYNLGFETTWTEPNRGSHRQNLV